MVVLASAHLPPMLFLSIGQTRSFERISVKGRRLRCRQLVRERQFGQGLNGSPSEVVTRSLSMQRCARGLVARRSCFVQRCERRVSSSGRYPRSSKSRRIALSVWRRGTRGFAIRAPRGGVEPVQAALLQVKHALPRAGGRAPALRRAGLIGCSATCVLARSEPRVSAAPPRFPTRRWISAPRRQRRLFLFVADRAVLPLQKSTICRVASD